MIEFGDDRGMILNPNEWPNFVLPVKRYRKDQNQSELGVIVEGKLTTVYLTSMYNTNILGADKKTYANVDDLLADGWIVDQNLALPVLY